MAEVNVVMSVLVAAVGGGMMGYCVADIRAAKDRATLVRAIVRQIWSTQIPQSAALSSSRHACHQLRGAIASRVLNLEGVSRAGVQEIARREPQPEASHA